MAVFNAENTAHKTGDYPLFLGQQMGMYDSINKKYPQLFELYKKQKEQDWAEDEVDLSQSISDFVTCSKSTYDVMVQTLMWQWEADSVAARSIICLFSPFITNSELFTLLMKQSEIEVLHALTYSEIVRQCLPNAREIIEEIQENQDVLSRSGVIVKYMQELEVIGAKYRLDPSSVEEDVVRKCILRALFALLALESIEFIASFACTFAVAEQGIFVQVAQLVQKIMLDEMLHSKGDFAIIDILLNDPAWEKSFLEIKGELKEILDEVRTKEYGWSDYIFSEGRAIIGLNSPLLKEWVDYNCSPIYDYYDIDKDFVPPTKDPLPFMQVWMKPSLQQTANQEMSNTDYRVNTTVNDAEEEIWEF